MFVYKFIRDFKGIPLLVIKIGQNIREDRFSNGYHMFRLSQLTNRTLKSTISEYAFKLGTKSKVGSNRLCNNLDSCAKLWVKSIFNQVLVHR